MPSVRPGTTIPITTPAFVTDADSRTPSMATAVINQIATTITPKRNAGFDASAGFEDVRRVRADHRHDRREGDDPGHPLQPHRREAATLAEGHAGPRVHAAGAGPARRQLRRDQCRRDEQQDDRQGVEEQRRVPVLGERRRAAEAGDVGDTEHRQREHPERPPVCWPPPVAHRLHARHRTRGGQRSELALRPCVPRWPWCCWRPSRVLRPTRSCGRRDDVIAALEDVGLRVCTTDESPTALDGAEQIARVDVAVGSCDSDATGQVVIATHPSEGDQDRLVSAAAGSAPPTVRRRGVDARHDDRGAVGRPRRRGRRPRRSGDEGPRRDLTGATVTPPLDHQDGNGGMLAWRSVPTGIRVLPVSRQRRSRLTS